MMWKRFLFTKTGVWAGLLLLLLSGITPAGEAPYVNGAIADAEFKKITAEHMDRLRKLKILFGSRSFGGNLRNGLNYLAGKNPIYTFTDSRFEASTFTSNGDTSVFPVDAFAKANWVQNWVIASPWARRVPTMRALLEEAPHFYQDDIDVFMIYFHGGDEKTFPIYSKAMDAMRKANPHIQFIYVTAGFEGPKQKRHNDAAAAFSALVRERYKGKAPLYDLGYILNDDGAIGNHYNPAYSGDPAQVHPNKPVAEMRMAKGLLVMLYKLFIENQPGATDATPTVPANLAGKDLGRYAARLTWGFSQLDGGKVVAYKIERNGKQVGVSKGFGYADRELAENSEYSYRVAAVGHNGTISDWSTPIKVTTFNDTEAPKLVGVRDLIRNDTIELDFSEPLAPATAGLASNYKLANGVAVQKVTVTGTRVALTTAPLPDNSETLLTFTNITDTSVNKNALAPDAQTRISYVNRTLDDMLAHWPLDGDGKDATGNGSDGTIEGAPVFGPGVKGRAMTPSEEKKSAVNVLLPGSKKAALGGMETLTIAIWARKSAADKGGVLFNRHVHYMMALGKDNVSAYLFNGKGQACPSLGTKAPEIQNTAWHHYSLIYDGKEVTLYIDGAVKAQVPLQGTVRRDAGRNLTIGRGLFKQHFQGAVDDMRIYAWPLTQAKVQELVQMGPGGGTTSDLQVVKAILKANGDTRALEGAAVVNDKGRVTKLFLQNDLGGKVFKLPAVIGQLTELEVLHAYGPEKHNHKKSKLTLIDPAIGKCSKLQELLLNDNDLTSLPETITALKKLKNFSVGNNRIAKVSAKLETWLRINDADWKNTQVAPAMK